MMTWDENDDTSKRERLLQLELEKMKAEQARQQSEMEQYGRSLSSIERQSGIVRPEYESPLIKDPETGQYSLPEQFQIQAPEALLEMERRALSEGPSAWAQRLEEQQRFQEQGIKDQGARQALAGTMQARQQLAMRGGLGGGAAERLAGQSARNLLESRQQAARAGMEQRMGIGLQDQAMKDQLLQTLPGMQMGMQEANIGTLSDLLTKQERAKQEDYKTQMQTWAAKEQAAATRSSGGGGGGCFITTACCEVLGLPDDNAILNTFRKFRDEHCGGKDGVKNYYVLAPKILEAMGEDKAYLYTIICDYLMPCHKLIKEDKNDEAYKLYEEMVNHMGRKYLLGKEK